MQELLLTIGGEGIPGPREFIGFDSVDNTGFYGEVSSSEFITPAQLSTLAGVQFGTLHNPDVSWLKFWIDDKIVFLAKKSIRYSLSYNQLVSKNLVNGSKIVNFRGFDFKVGLIERLNPNYSGGIFTNGHNLPIAEKSQWNRLMYRVSEDNPSYPKLNQVGPNWVDYPQDDSVNGLNLLGNGRYSWCKEAIDSSVAANVGAVVTYSNQGNRLDSNLATGWRPMLEIIL